MPLLKPVNKNTISIEEVKEAIAYMANLEMCHTDLKWDHVGL